MSEMTVERHYGRDIVVGHIFPAHEVEIGSVWQSSTGNTVTVTANDGEWITYQWAEAREVDGVMQTQIKSHEKLCFAFQCRYCLVVG